jgi:hypothetical protein
MFTLANFYQSREWTAFKEGLMQERTGEDGFLRCARCGLPIVARYDCIGHHVIELTDENVADAAVSLNPANVELVHFRCHNAIHERFGAYQRRVFLVYGAPCAGKSTWVRENAAADDLILDIDRLWEAVSVSDRYHKHPRIAQNVFGLRDCLIDQIRVRAGKWRRAFVVGGYPLRSERDRLCGLVGAEPIFVDTDEETCLARAENEQWRGFVRDWFEAYVE